MKYTIPACDVRSGDQITIGDQYLAVVHSHEYYGIPGPLDGSWVIVTKRSEEDWPWAEYPTYGPKVDDNGNEYWPEDCTEEHEYQPDALVEISTDDPQVLDPKTLLPIRWWAVVYELALGFGGREEGGWFFDVGTLCVSVPCRSRAKAEAVVERLRKKWPSTGRASSVVYAGGDYGVWISPEEPAEYFPERKPRYA